MQNSKRAHNHQMQRELMISTKPETYEKLWWAKQVVGLRCGLSVTGASFVSTLFLLLFSALLFAQPSVTLLRDRAPEDQPTLLVLGSAHFANPGRDLINVDVEDVLSERRQTEIEAVVEQLARFRPTHVAVEVAPSRQAELDVRYRAYLEGRHALSRNEVEQLEFRLAAAAGHGRVFAMDTYVDSPGVPAMLIC